MRNGPQSFEANGVKSLERMNREKYVSTFKLPPLA